MRALGFLIAATLSLSACVTTSASSVDTSGPTSVPPGKAVVVVGLSTPNGSGQNTTKITRYDPATMAVDPYAALTEIKCRQWNLEPCRPNTKKVIVADPGDYVFESVDPDNRTPSLHALVDYGDTLMILCGSGSCTQSFSGKARAMPATPHFSVKAGEVLYVGDFVVPPSTTGSMRFTRTEDEAGARAALGKTGLAERMVTRLFEPSTATPFPLKTSRW